MKLRWKLREKLIFMTVAAGLIPLFCATLYVGHIAKVLLEDQAMDYIEAKVNNFARTVEIRNNAIKGNLDIIRDQLTKLLKDDLIKEASRERYFENGHLIIFKSNGECIYHPENDYKNNTKLYNSFDSIREGVAKKQGFYRYDFDGDTKWGYLVYNKDFDWIIWGAAAEDEVLAGVFNLKKTMYGFLVIISIAVAFLGYFMAQTIAKAAGKISAQMMNIAEGEADLSVRLPVLSNDEIGDIANWFNKFLERLEEVITQVKLTAVQVDTATQEVASGSQGLSQATQQQASSIEEVAATIEEMTSSIKQNASNATDGRQKAMDMVQMANSSGEASHELVRGMGEISDASKKIGDIIVTVNEVAFQTNLLALNAAVEAARAGEHGKGFAVVAEEVRALAQRSADAARQIKSLIEDTVNKVKAGDEMVKNSGEALTKIITHIEDLSQTMDEIAASSSEQASGVDEVNRAIAQIDSTTQQNASTVEELAGTSDNLSTEAKDLAEIVSRFKVSGIGMDSLKGTPKKIERAKERRGTLKAKAQQLPRHQPAPSAITSMDMDDFEEF